MTGEASASARTFARPTGRRGRPIGRRFATLMVAVRSWWPNKQAEQLAALLGCDVRSAERYLAGDRVPSAEAVLALICSEHGLKLIDATLGEMPIAEMEAFWNEMAKASRRRALQAEMARIERQLEDDA